MWKFREFFRIVQRTLMCNSQYELCHSFFIVKEHNVLIHIFFKNIRFIKGWIGVYIVCVDKKNKKIT